MNIDHPQKSNSLTGSMMCDLSSAVDELLFSTVHEDKTVLIITSSRAATSKSKSKATVFSAGADFGLVTDVVNTPERGRMMCEFMTDALNRVRSSIPFLSVAVLG